jgi:hypothetical protein
MKQRWDRRKRRRFRLSRTRSRSGARQCVLRVPSMLPAHSGRENRFFKEDTKPQRFPAPAARRSHMTTTPNAAQRPTIDVAVFAHIAARGRSERQRKIYGIDPEGEKRYSPAICTSCESHPALRQCLVQERLNTDPIRHSILSAASAPAPPPPGSRNPLRELVYWPKPALRRSSRRQPVASHAPSGSETVIAPLPPRLRQPERAPTVPEVRISSVIE